MSNRTVNGKNDAILQPDEFSYAPFQGYTQGRKWHGTKEKILPLMGQLSLAGVAFRCYSPNGAVWYLEATNSFTPGGAAEVPIDIWESTNNVIGTEITTAPACAGISTADLQTIAKNISSPSDTEPALTGAALTAFRLMRRGVGYIVFQPIIRHTQVVSNQYGTKAAYANVGGILKTSSIAAPSGFLMGLPADGTGSSGMEGGSNFGWMKKPPQVQTAAGNKIQIVQEFEFGDWSTFLYGALI